MKNCDVAIVGGGPVGGYISKIISKKGYKVEIFEEHEKIGTPLKCAGLISERAFDLLEFPKKKVVENKIYGANIQSPYGDILTIGGDRIHALVIDRTRFDQEILNLAEKTGASINLKTKVLSVKVKNNFVEIDINKDKKNIKIKSSLLIGADGPYSKVRSSINLPKPKEFLKGIGASVENTSLDPKYVEIFVGRKIAPGFFAWVIPTKKDGTEARIGLCIDDTSNYSLKQCFNVLLKQKILKDIIIKKKIAGTIPLGPLKQTTDDNVMIVGDAAAQVKPTSGGGIYPGILCGRYCSDVAIQALESQDFSGQNLKRYNRLWTKDIGRELNLGMKFRRIIKNIDDKKMDKYIKKLNTTNNIEIINHYGDIDFPSKLAFPLFKKNPTFLKLIPTALKKSKNK